MLKTKKENHIPAVQIITRSIKTPAILLITGLILSSLNLLKIFPFYMKWHNQIFIARRIGEVLVNISGIAFIYLVLIGLCKSYEKFFIEKSYQTVAHLITIIANGLKVIFALIVFNTMLSGFELQREYFELAHNIIYIVIISAVAWILLQILNMIESMLYRKSLEKTDNRSMRNASALYTKIHIIKNIAAVLIIIVAIAASLMVFEKVRNIGISLLASAGFLTAIFALAAQKTLGSFFVGLQLVLSQPLEIGDFVVVENELGTVTEINLSYVTIKTLDGRQVIFPINYFIEKPFQNWSKEPESLQANVKVYVNYTFPVNQLRENLPEILKKIHYWDGKISRLAISSCSEKNIELRITASTTHPSGMDKLCCELREALLKYIHEHYPNCLPA